MIQKKNITKISDSSNNQTKNLNGITITNKEQRDFYPLDINKNDKEIKNYIDSLDFDKFSPWEPKLFMNVFKLAEHQKDYCPMLKIGWRKTLFLKHSLRRQLFWVCLGVALVACCEPEFEYCEWI